MDSIPMDAIPTNVGQGWDRVISVGIWHWTVSPVFFKYGPKIFIGIVCRNSDHQNIDVQLALGIFGFQRVQT